MTALRYIVPVLAVAAQAAAQCSVSATTTIQSSGDATALASCQTFSGSIAIATGASGQIQLDGIEKIDGDLVANNVTQLTQLSGSSLSSITGSMTLDALTILTGLNFPMLTSVKDIEWAGLPALQALTFTAGIQMAETVSIQNTQLNSLDGINLQQVTTMTIANNRFLTDIAMQLGNVTDDLSLDSNGRNVTATFPNLIWANNITISNVTDLNLASLQAVNGSMNLVANFFSSLSAPNLTTVGGGFTVTANAQVSNITFPELTTVNGALNVQNNTDLTAIDGFPKLATVGGALDFYGNFSSVKLPALKQVQGGFNIQSSSSSSELTSDCSNFQNEAGASDVIRGKFYCHGNETVPGDSSTAGGSGTSSSSSKTSSGAANPMVITGATGLLGVAAAIFGML